MKKIALFLVATFAVLFTQDANADFLLRFDNVTTSAQVGQTASIGVILEETSGSNFSSPLTGFAFSVTNSNDSVASMVGFTPNAAFNIGSTSGSTFVYSTFGSGVTGGSRTLGTIQFNAAQQGSTNFQLALHPTSQTPELTFGSFPNFNSIDLNTAGIPVTFNTGTLTITAVPEPSSIALLGLVAVGGVAFRRFRKKAQAA